MATLTQTIRNARSRIISRTPRNASSMTSISQRAGATQTVKTLKRSMAKCSVSGQIAVMTINEKLFQC